MTAVSVYAIQPLGGHVADHRVCRHRRGAVRDPAGRSRSRSRAPRTSASGPRSRSCRSSATRSGPIVGFFTGFVGNAIGDQISGWGALTSWNWSIANGIVGFVAGLAPLYLASMMAGTVARKAIAGAIAGAVGVLIGFLFVFTDMIISGLRRRTRCSPPSTSRSSSTNLIATIILVPDPRRGLGAGQGTAGTLSEPTAPVRP